MRPLGGTTRAFIALLGGGAILAALLVASAASAQDGAAPPIDLAPPPAQEPQRDPGPIAPVPYPNPLFAGGRAPAPAVAAPAAQPAPAQPQLSYAQQQAQALQRIHTYFNAVRTMTGRFTQIAPDGTLQEGVFTMSRPGRINFDYTNPDELKVISDGTTVMVQNDFARTQQTYFLRQTPLRYLLADHIDLTSDSTVRDIILEGDLITVVLTEDNETDGWLTLMFDPETYELRQWATTTQGQTVTVAIYDTRTNQPVDDQQFRIFVWTDIPM
ncbi:MAG: outer-membrane lipoprotein carrier protein LolA [Bauldia sp.]|nr:outer-membrane lipoprotein carrier protein LolA [Bauldia sp.]